MKILLGADLVPTKNTSPLYIAGDTEKLFGKICGMVKDYDRFIVNLECALTESENRIKKFGPNIKAPLETAEVLSDFGVNLVGLSNNHSFDLGVVGIKDTLSALQSAGVDYTGFGENYEDSRKNYYYEKDGERIAVVAVCEHEYSYALENRMGARPFDEFDTIDDIREAKKNADRVVVMYHGGKEFSKYPSPRLLRAARAMVRAGADLVLCQHSHCIGCYEKYMDGHILYGQGNFHFLDPDPRESWYTELAVEYDTKSNEISFIPLRTTDDYISLAKGDDREEIMSSFEKRNEELKTGAWKDGWHDFCESMKERYYEAIERALVSADDDRWYRYFGHMLDCEAHTDVWRELFPSWNLTNCLEDK